MREKGQGNGVSDEPRGVTERSRPDVLREADMSFEQIMLQPHTFAARSEVTRQFMHDVRMESEASYTRDSMIFGLWKKVYAREVGYDDQIVGWAANRDVAPTRSMRIRGFAAATLLGLLAAFAQSPITTFICVVVAAWVAFESTKQRIRVEGNTILRARKWTGFPEDTTQYPDHMGPRCMVLTTDAPWNEPREPSGLQQNETTPSLSRPGSQEPPKPTSKDNT